MSAANDLPAAGRFRVGLTGGIGSGKSVVAERFAERGAAIIDADLLAREVVAPGTPGFDAIAERWPHAVGGNGLDRAVLARVVFADARARAELNAIVHPAVRARAAEVEAAVPRSVLPVHVVPLLFEGDWWRSCAATVLVIAPYDARIERVIARDGLSRAAVEARIAAQIDPEVARTLATDVIENHGDLGNLRERADAVYDGLIARCVR